MVKIRTMYFNPEWNGACSKFLWVLKGIDKCESLRGNMEKINELSLPINYVVGPTSNWLVYGLKLYFKI